MKMKEDGHLWGNAMLVPMRNEYGLSEKMTHSDMEEILIGRFQLARIANR